MFVVVFAVVVAVYVCLVFGLFGGILFFWRDPSSGELKQQKLQEIKRHSFGCYFRSKRILY